MKLRYLAFVRLPTEKAHGLQIMKTCEAFARGGVEVELVVPRRRNPLASDPFSYYGVEKNFILTTLSGPDWVSSGRLGFLASLLWFSEAAARQGAFWSADIIYSRDALVLFQYLLLGRKTVFEAHAPPTWVSRIVARCAFRVVVISRALARAYEVAGVTREKIVVAPDGVDLAFFSSTQSRSEARQALGLPEGKLVLYAGHLYARKGADTAAEAARALPEISFLFVGGTEGEVARFTSLYGSIPNIRILGHRPHDQIPSYLRAADLLLLPNSAKDADSRVYGSPMKLFEYMASGTPILASDVPALREVLDDASASLFTPDDPRNLAAQIQTVLADGSSKGVAAKEKVRAYAWDARAARILSSFI